MSDKVDKHIENLVDKSMKRQSLEAPSLDFTKHVMSQVEVSQGSAITRYKPLITKPMWYFIIISFLMFIAYAFSIITFQESDWFQQIDFSFFSNRVVNMLSAVSFSRSLLYSFLVLAIMIVIQVPLLKHYFNKRLKSVI